MSLEKRSTSIHEDSREVGPPSSDAVEDVFIEKADHDFHYKTLSWQASGACAGNAKITLNAGATSL